jgi:hypothetical protein
MRNVITGIVAGLVIVAAMSFSMKAAGDAERQMQDRIEIEALMWKYTRSLDGFDPEGYASTYTADGQFIAGANPTKGHDALKKMIADLKQRRAEDEAKGNKQAAMYHQTLNEHVEFIDKDHARINAYWQTSFGAVGQTPMRIAAVGRSIDDLVRVNGKWLIKTRNVTPQD